MCKRKVKKFDRVICSLYGGMCAHMKESVLNKNKTDYWNGYSIECKWTFLTDYGTVLISFPFHCLRHSGLSHIVWHIERCGNLYHFNRCHRKGVWAKSEKSVSRWNVLVYAKKQKQKIILNKLRSDEWMSASLLSQRKYRCVPSSLFTGPKATKWMKNKGKYIW